MTALGADGSITPSALLSLLAKQTVDYVVQASVVHWWRERPEETCDLLDFCCRSNRIGGAIGAARTLLKLPASAARRMGEDVLARLADDGHSGAQMELARWRIHQWQQSSCREEERRAVGIACRRQLNRPTLTPHRTNRYGSRMLDPIAARPCGPPARCEGVLVPERTAAWRPSLSSRPGLLPCVTYLRPGLAGPYLTMST
jgi:hypothetical protein